MSNGKRLRTLRDVAAHILELPEDQRKTVRWQNVTAALIRASEGGEIREVNMAFRLASAMRTSAA